MPSTDPFARSRRRRGVHLRTAAVTLLGLVLGGLLVFAVLERPFGGSRLLLAVPPEAVELLQASMDDQRLLAGLDPEAAASYKGRFEEVQTLLGRLRILEHNRDRLESRHRTLLLALATAGLLAAGSVLALGRGRDAARLEAAAESRRTAQRHLAAWQEAARRHSHELRTPLAAARLHLHRLRRHTAEQGEAAREIAAAAEAVDGELEQLGRFAHRFATFARLPQPAPVPADLVELVEDFAGTFAAAWPGVELAVERPPDGGVPAAVDRALLRQVLANLCDNAAHALGARGGRVELAVTTRGGLAVVSVRDDGPGVPPELRDRLFEPYVSGRAPGESDGAEGSGLGLAISRKVMLDHGGELELAATGPEGTVFRLLLPGLTGKEAAA